LEFDGLEYLKVLGFEFTINSNGNISGRHSQKMIGRKSFKGFSDFHGTIEDIIAEGDKVWVRTTMTGTLFPISLA